MNQKIENTEGFKRDRRREILTVHGIEPGPSRVQGNLTDHYATRPSLTSQPTSTGNGAEEASKVEGRSLPANF